MEFFDNIKEKKIQELAVKHLEVVGACLEALYNTIGASFKKENFNEYSYNAHKFEDRVGRDGLEAEILLNEVAFIPLIREDYIGVIDFIDNIADKTETTADLLTLTRPQMFEKFVDEIDYLAQESIQTFSLLKELVLNVINEDKKILDKTHFIEEKEKLVDKLQWQLLNKIFKTDIPLANKLLLKEMIDDIAAISDRVEDASDRLSLMVVKQVTC